MECPKCKKFFFSYKKIGTFSTMYWFIAWTCLGIIPGIIYAVYWDNKKAEHCPNCKKRVRKIIERSR